MKAAVLHEIGGIPHYEDFPDPVAGDDEVVIDVKAVAVENVDKRIAAGTHYASPLASCRARPYSSKAPPGSRGDSR
jgi:NADPH:quinone reductase-like Zn-dependent oxidoreductase